MSKPLDIETTIHIDNYGCSAFANAKSGIIAAILRR